MGDVLKWQLERPRRTRERQPLVPNALARFAGLPSAARLLSLGHASFLVELDGVRFLIDPIFGRAGGVVPRLAELPVAVDALPRPDVVLLTHGHHDHACAASLRALAERHGEHALFVVPSGLRKLATKRARKVVELAWWQSVKVGGVEIVFVPSQHWHRRGLTDENEGLWGGFVLRGSKSIYHSGDTGFFPGFELVGRTFGGVDVAILPLGAYEPRWIMQTQHMSPEGSLAAFDALRARHFVGMHWGTFDLADEGPTDGPALLEALVRDDAARDPADFSVLGHGGSLSFDGQVWAEGRRVEWQLGRGETF